MLVNHIINMDLTGSDPISTLEMMQSDQLSRQVTLRLSCADEALTVPEDAGVMIHYLRSDGEGGAYDTLPDGTLAWSISGSELTITLAPEILSCAGTAAVSARLIRGARTLNTFTFLIRVHKAIPVGEGSGASKLCWYLPAPPTAQAGQLLAAASVDENGVITALEAVDAPEIDTSFCSLGEVYAQKLRVTGRFSTDAGITVTLNGSRLQNVGTPTADTDAATKAYVDQQIAAALESLANT